MDVSAAAGAASASSLATVQGQASMLVLKKAMELQAAHALQLLQGLPQPMPTPGATVGGTINTYA